MSVILLLHVKDTLEAIMVDILCLNPKMSLFLKGTPQKPVESVRKNRGVGVCLWKKNSCKSPVIPVCQELKLKPTLPPSYSLSANSHSGGGH